MKVTFFGNDAFALPALEALLKEADNAVDGVVSSVNIICSPDKPSGRGMKLHPVPVKAYASGSTLDVSTPTFPLEKDYKIPHEADLAVVVSFGHFLPRRLISQFPLGALNIHPSLLPKYPGAAPIQHAILEGDTESGVTIQEVSPVAFDAGRILLQEKMALFEDDTSEQVEGRASKIGAELLIRVLRNYTKFKDGAREQGTRGKVASKVRKEATVVDWEKDTSARISRLDRAVGERMPLRSMFRGKSIHFLGPLTVASSPPSVGKHPAGTVVWKDRVPGNVLISCAEGSWLQVSKIKLEGKRAVSVSQWVEGYSMVSGEEKLGQ